MFELAMVQELSVFELFRFDCIISELTYSEAKIYIAPDKGCI